MPSRVRPRLAAVARLIGCQEPALLAAALGLAKSPQAAARLVRSKRICLRLAKLVARRLNRPDPMSAECAPLLSFVAAYDVSMTRTATLIGLAGAFAAFGSVLLKPDIRKLADEFGSAMVEAAMRSRQLAPAMHGATPASVIEDRSALVVHGAPLLKAWARLKFGAAGAWLVAALPHTQAPCAISNDQAARIERLVRLRLDAVAMRAAA